MKRLHTLLVIVCVVSMVVAFMFMGSCKAAPAPTPTPTTLPAVKQFKIGFLYGMTGPWIGYGIPFAKCWKLQAERLNDEGGITVGGEKYLIDYVEADTAGRPETAMTAARKLLFQDQVKFIVGPCDGDSGVALMDLFAENKAIMICQGSSQKLISAANKYSFKVHFPGSLMSAGYPAFLAERYPDIHNIAEIVPESDAAYEEVKMIQGGVAEVNAKEPGRLQVVYEGYAPEDATDFSAVLTAALAKKPDIIHMDAADPPWMALVIKQARELGYKGWFISGGGQTLSTLLEVAGKAFAYNIITPSWSFERPCPVSVPAGQEANWKKFCDMYGDWTWLAEAWKTEYKEDLPGAVIYGNDAFNTEIMGILAADSFDTDKVVTALEDMEYVPTYFGMGTWMGKETWGQNHQIRRPITLYIIQNGELFPVEPPVMPAYYP